MDALIRAKGLVKEFRVPGGARRVRALDGVDLELGAGERLALVGGSGSGKSTLARALLWLDPPDAGEVEFLGRPLRRLPAKDLRRLRRDFQMVFQDPGSSLDPRWSVGDIVTENLAVHEGLKGAARREAAAGLLERVALDPALAARRPHELSGGQRQRVALARAVATRPRLLVADEPVSSLDLELQAQLMGLLRGLTDAGGMALVLVTHDLRLARAHCGRVAVLDAGKVVEEGPAERLLRAPAHAATRELVDAALPRCGAALPLPLPQCGAAQPQPQQIIPG